MRTGASPTEPEGFVGMESAHRTTGVLCGLKLPKSEVETILQKSGISPDARAETLSLDDWARLTNCVVAE